MNIRPVHRDDLPAWRALWAAYQSFYEVALSEETTATTWARLFEADSTIHALVAEEDGTVIGLCHYIVHANTWEVDPVCYLEDLYVEPPGRARGVGEALIAHLRSMMSSEKWSRIYWMTREDNYRARGLYDKFVKRDAFVRYVIRR